MDWLCLWICFLAPQPTIDFIVNPSAEYFLPLSFYWSDVREKKNSSQATYAPISRLIEIACYVWATIQTHSYSICYKKTIQCSRRMTQMINLVLKLLQINFLLMDELTNHCSSNVLSSSFWSNLLVGNTAKKEYENKNGFSWGNRSLGGDDRSKGQIGLIALHFTPWFIACCCKSLQVCTSVCRGMTWHSPAGELVFVCKGGSGCEITLNILFRKISPRCLNCARYSTLLHYTTGCLHAAVVKLFYHHPVGNTVNAMLSVAWVRRDTDTHTLPLTAARLHCFFVLLPFFRLFRQQPGMDIESVSARAESGE